MASHLDTVWRDEPMCPWCGEEVTDAPNVDVPMMVTAVAMECAECGQAVLVTARVQRRYHVASGPAHDSR